MKNSSENNPLISVIVPVFNLENEIERCVKSILSQTYRNLEVILVDDGSVDQSRFVIRRLAKLDNRIKSIYKENGGVTSARFEGIKYAAGHYIGFVDGDDEIESNMYEFLMKNLLDYNAEISHCGYQMHFNDGRSNFFYNSGQVKVQDNYTGIVDLLEGALVEPGLCNKLYKKELFADIISRNRMDLSIKINEDLLLNYYLFKQAKTSIFEDKCPYHYIVRPSSATRKSLNSIRITDPIRVKEIIYEDCGDELKEAAEKALVNTAIYSMATLSLEDHSLFKKERKMLRQVIRKHKSVIMLLPKRTGLLGKTIYYCPSLFNVIYPFYARRFQKKKYE